MPACNFELAGLGLLASALALSLFLNVVFYIRQRASQRRDTVGCRNSQIYHGQSLSQDNENYLQNNLHEQQESPCNHQVQQENPIYGNVCKDRRGSGGDCDEIMSVPNTRDCKKPLEPNVNYASLDLTMANKHKKKLRHQQGHTRGQNKLQDQLPNHITAHVNACLEAETDTDARLPSRDTSTAVSHSSIYMNTQQIAQDTEDMD